MVVDSLPNISLNLTGFYNPVPSAESICELNQLAMLENVQKFPKVMFYFALASFVVLAFYVYVLPRIKFRSEGFGRLVQASLPMLSLGLLVWALIFAYFITWSVDVDTWDSWVPFIKVGIGVAVLLVILAYWGRIKLFWVGLRDGNR
jgi:hypothetical protein